MKKAALLLLAFAAATAQPVQRPQPKIWVGDMSMRGIVLRQTLALEATDTKPADQYLCSWNPLLCNQSPKPPL